MYLLWRPSVDGRIILKMIFEKYDVRVWTGFGWIRIVSMADLYRHSTNNRVQLQL